MSELSNSDLMFNLFSSDNEQVPSIFIKIK